MKKKALALILIFVLILAACGRADDDAIVIPDFEVADHGHGATGLLTTPRPPAPRPQFVRDDGSPMAQILDALYNFRANDLPDDSHPFYGETLTIFVRANFNYDFASPLVWELDCSGAQFLANSYMRQNPGVYVEVRMIDGFRVSHQVISDTVFNELAAGTADTLFNVFGLFDPASPEAAQHLADWYPIMRTDPRFNEDDWLMNVLYASMVNGHLRSFPIAFNFNSLAANSFIPGLTEAFAELDYITYAHMLALHERYAEGFYVYQGFNQEIAVSRTLCDFADVANRTADFFNSRFVNLIEYTQDLANPARPLSATRLRLVRAREFELLVDIPFLNAASELYAFYSPLWFSGTHFYSMMEFTHDSIFVGAVPVVDGGGQLFAEVSPLTFELNAAASYIQQALAWDFIVHMLQPDNQHPHSIINHAVYIPLLRQQTAQEVANIADRMQAEGYELEHNLEHTIESVTRRLINIGQMPMRTTCPLHRRVLSIVNYELEWFNADETIDIWYTARNIQDAVEQMFFE